MHSIYVTYINFCSTNLQILYSICVVISQMFGMLKPIMQHLEEKNVIVDDPKYTRYTSVYCVTDYVCII